MYDVASQQMPRLRLADLGGVGGHSRVFSTLFDPLPRQSVLFEGRAGLAPKDNVL